MSVDVFLMMIIEGSGPTSPGCIFHKDTADVDETISNVNDGGLKVI